MVSLEYESMILVFNNIINSLEGDIVVLKEITDKDFKKFIKQFVKKMINYAKRIK